MKITVNQCTKRIKKMDTCVLVVLSPKPPLPKGLPALPDVSGATVAVFIASKQWTKVEEALRHDPTDELIVEASPPTTPRSQFTAVWAQILHHQNAPREIRAQQSEGVLCTFYPGSLARRAGKGARSCKGVWVAQSTARTPCFLHTQQSTLQLQPLNHIVENRPSAHAPHPGARPGCCYARRNCVCSTTHRAQAPSPA